MPSGVVSQKLVEPEHKSEENERHRQEVLFVDQRRNRKEQEH